MIDQSVSNVIEHKMLLARKTIVFFMLFSNTYYVLSFSSKRQYSSDSSQVSCVPLHVLSPINLFTLEVLDVCISS